VSRPERASRRVNTVGAILAVILVAFLLGLTYVAQTVQFAATQYQIAQHQTQAEDLHRQIQTIETSVLRWGAESTVIQRAQDLGLDQLPAGTRLIAR
jgi:cytochrome c-type biogenesis protein CcmE